MIDIYIKKMKSDNAGGFTELNIVVRIEDGGLEEVLSDKVYRVYISNFELPKTLLIRFHIRETTFPQYCDWTYVISLERTYSIINEDLRKALSDDSENSIIEIVGYKIVSKKTNVSDIRFETCEGSNPFKASV